MDQPGSSSPPPGAQDRPHGEQQRLMELRQLGLLDTAPDESFDRIARLAASSLGVPMAVVSLVDESREWFKARVGVAAAAFPREHSFSARAITDHRVLIIRDTAQDPRFAANPLVTGAPHVRACMAVPINTKGGQPIGTLCGMDTQPREFTAGQFAVWNDFAGLVQDMIHAREMAAESEWLLRSVAASEQKHTLMERRLQRIADSIPAMIGYWNTGLHCEFANDAYRAYSGLTPQQMIGKHFRELLGDDLYARNSPHAYAALAGQPQRFQRCTVDAEGRPRYTEAQYMPDRDEHGAVRGFFVLVTDVTELTTAKGALEVSNAKLLKESTTDFLTGLANRRVFSERIEGLFRRCRETGEGYALILLDLDDFKRINDQLGHEVGDRVLRAVGEVLAGSLRGLEDVAARLGGEEFAILCPGSFSMESLCELAGRIRVLINRTTVEGPQGRVHFTSSFGVACSSTEDAAWTNAFARADSALYEAKETGKDRIVFGHSTAMGSTGRFRALGIPSGGE